MQKSDGTTPSNPPCHPSPRPSLHFWQPFITLHLSAHQTVTQPFTGWHPAVNLYTNSTWNHESDLETSDQLLLASLSEALDFQYQPWWLIQSNSFTSVTVKAEAHVAGIYWVGEKMLWTFLYQHFGDPHLLLENVLHRHLKWPSAKLHKHPQQEEASLNLRAINAQAPIG